MDEQKKFRSRARNFGNSRGFIVKKDDIVLEIGKVYEFMEVIDDD